MAVTRDYKIDSIDIKDSFLPEAKVGSSSSSGEPSGGNVLLQGSITRTNTSGGMVATVNGGENIQVAIENVLKAGGGTVVLLPGVYVLTQDISIPDGVTLEGASRDGVLIDCNTDYKVVIEGSDPYATGTVNIATGDTTVIGVGTAWTSDMVGQYIFLSGFFYEITAFNSSLSLEIGEIYTEETLVASTYILATVNFNASLRRVTVFNATGTGVKVEYAVEPNLDDIIVYDCGTGIEILYSVYPRIYTTSSSNNINMDLYYVWGFKVDFSGFDFSLQDGTSKGVRMQYCGSATFFDSSISGNYTGLYMLECRDITFLSITVTGNTNNGIVIQDTNDIQFVGAVLELNTGSGLVIADDSNRNTIVASSISNNSDYGITISSASADANYIIAPILFDNNLGGIDDNGTDTVILPNTDAVTITNNAVYLVANLPSTTTIVGPSVASAYE